MELEIKEGNLKSMQGTQEVVERDVQPKGSTHNMKIDSSRKLILDCQIELLFLLNKIHADTTDHFLVKYVALICSIWGLRLHG